MYPHKPMMASMNSIYTKICNRLLNLDCENQHKHEGQCIEESKCFHPESKLR